MQAADRSRQIPPAASGAGGAAPAADPESAQLWEAARALNLLDDQVSTLNLTRHHSTWYLPGTPTLDTLRSHHQPCLEELSGGLATNPSSLAWQHSMQTPWWLNEPHSEPPGGTAWQHDLETPRGPAKQLPDGLDGSQAAGGVHLAADGRAGQHAAATAVGRERLAGGEAGQAAHAALWRAGSGAGAGPALSTGRQAAHAAVEPAGASEGLRSFRVTGDLDSEPPSARVTGDPLAGMGALGEPGAGAGCGLSGQAVRMVVQHCWSSFQLLRQGVAVRGVSSSRLHEVQVAPEQNIGCMHIAVQGLGPPSSALSSVLLPEQVTAAFMLARLLREPWCTANDACLTRFKNPATECT